MSDVKLNPTNITINPKAEKVLKVGNNRFLLKLTLFKMLPMAALAKVGIKSFDKEKCITTVPYRYINKNPFNSTYFAVLAMAAEFSTGYLLMYHTYKRNVAWLVTKMDANFTKKATKITYFTCNQGSLAAQTVNNALNSNEAQEIKMQTIGNNSDGEIVATFNFTWSIKKRKEKNGN